MPGKLSFPVGGRSQTTLTRRERYLDGTGNVNSMHIFPLTVKKILHYCQTGVGK